MKQKNETQIKSQREEKPLRTRQAPKEIEALLAIANMLPRAPARREIGKAYHAHENVVDAHKYDGDADWLSFYLKEAVNRLPPELQAFVTQDFKVKDIKDGEIILPPLDERWQQAGQHLQHLLNYARDFHHLLSYFSTFPVISDVESMRQKYLFLFAVRDILRCVAQPDIVSAAIRLAWKAEGVPPVLSDPQGWYEAAWRSLLHSSRLYRKVDGLRSQLYVSHNKTREGTHKFAVYQPILFKVLEDIEIERIRECPICEKLFWAGRLDQSACSPRCSNVRRGRAWRSKYHEQYKQQRKQKAAAGNEKAADRKQATTGKTRQRAIKKEKKGK